MSDTKQEVIERAIVGLPRVADALVSVPADVRATALLAVKDSYRQSARDLGYNDGEAESWVDAMMFRLWSEVAARSSLSRRKRPAVLS